MTKTISIKDFRNNISSIADKAEKGQEFIVMRHSKPAFKITPIQIQDDDDGAWETIVDFTDGGKTNGVKAQDILKVMKKLNS